MKKVHSIQFWSWTLNTKQIKKYCLAEETRKHYLWYNYTRYFLSHQQKLIPCYLFWFASQDYLIEIYLAKFFRYADDKLYRVDRCWKDTQVLDFKE